MIEEVQNRIGRSATLAPDYTNEKIDAIAQPIIQSYRELKKPITDSFGGTLKSHISISMTIKSFVVAQMCQALFHWAKPYLPCMRGTKVGMLTQEELDRMSVKRMKYYRVIFYDTPEWTLSAITNTPEGFKQLPLSGTNDRRREKENSEKRDDEKRVEDSPFLKIAESST